MKHIEREIAWNDLCALCNFTCHLHKIVTTVPFIINDRCSTDIEMRKWNFHRKSNLPSISRSILVPSLYFRFLTHSRFLSVGGRKEVEEEDLIQENFSKTASAEFHKLIQTYNLELKTNSFD